jgi:hypothetical protein
MLISLNFVTFQIQVTILDNKSALYVHCVNASLPLISQKNRGKPCCCVGCVFGSLIFGSRKQGSKRMLILFVIDLSQEYYLQLKSISGAHSTTELRGCALAF